MLNTIKQFTLIIAVDSFSKFYKVESEVISKDSGSSMVKVLTFYVPQVTVLHIRVSQSHYFTQG